MSSQIIGFTATVPMLLAAIAGLWESKFPKAAGAVALPLALLSGVLLLAAVYVSQFE
jgi:hypothetical protein